MIPYPHLTRDARVRPDPNAIANRSATSYEGVRSDFTISTDFRIMSDMYKGVDDTAVAYLCESPKNRSG